MTIARTLPDPAALYDSASALAEEIVMLRRAIHAEPETGLHTPATMAKVRAALADLPLEWREGTSTTGQVAVLTGGRPAAPGHSSVILRGDMDALEMEERTGLPFASTVPGRMHACGHDTHTAMLAGAARLLCERRDEIAGEVLFMFQPGEEGHHGARFMLEDGLLESEAGGGFPQAAFALHVMPNARHGLIAGRTGALMASADQFDIVVEGRGGHASMPHDTADPVPAAAAIVGALQTMVTRRFDAADAVVCTVTRMDAGTAHNIVPDTARLRGTLRSLSPRHRQRLRDLLRETATATAAAHGVEARVEIVEGFPVTICDARAVAAGQAVATELFGAEDWKTLDAPIMGAEDFAYVLERTPGAMFFLGVAAEGEDFSACCGIHSPRMVVDEGALPRGTALLAGCALRFLERGWN